LTLPKAHYRVAQVVGDEPFPNQDMRAEPRFVANRLGMAQLLILRLGLKEPLRRAAIESI